MLTYINKICIIFAFLPALLANRYNCCTFALSKEKHRPLRKEIVALVLR